MACYIYVRECEMDHHSDNKNFVPNPFRTTVAIWKTFPNTMWFAEIKSIVTAT